MKERVGEINNDGEGKELRAMSGVPCHVFSVERVQQLPDDLCLVRHEW